MTDTETREVAQAIHTIVIEWRDRAWAAEAEPF